MPLDYFAFVQSQGSKLSEPFSLLSLQKQIPPIDFADSQTQRIFETRQDIAVRQGIDFFSGRETA